MKKSAQKTLPRWSEADIREAGVDEAGRGCLAGDVFAAAVILPPHYDNPALQDSKKLSAHQREALRHEIETNALAWAVGRASVAEIAEINILRAAILAMHRALEGLKCQPEYIIVDGNKFIPYHDIPYRTIVKGDAKYQNIAAASILAKTHRDEYMAQLHERYPLYGWDHNAGYGTEEHRRAIALHGITPEHRTTFRLVDDGQLCLF